MNNDAARAEVERLKAEMRALCERVALETLRLCAEGEYNFERSQGEISDDDPDIARAVARVLGEKT